MDDLTVLLTQNTEGIVRFLKQKQTPGFSFMESNWENIYSGFVCQHRDRLKEENGTREWPNWKEAFAGGRVEKELHLQWLLIMNFNFLKNVNIYFGM